MPKRTYILHLLTQEPLSKWQDSYCRNIISRPPIIHTTKKGDKNEKKGDETKSEDKDNSNIGTAGGYVGKTTTLQDSSTSSNRSSICAHVLDVTEPDV